MTPRQAARNDDERIEYKKMLAEIQERQASPVARADEAATAYQRLLEKEELRGELKAQRAGILNNREAAKAEYLKLKAEKV